MDGQQKKALIAMSGGVDSSVAAYLMQQQGWQCIGANMRLFAGKPGNGAEQTCGTLSDSDEARNIAERLDMPFYVFDFKDDFEQEVICRFVRTYERGETPNPCIDCNRYLKFGRLYRRAQELGCDVIATGHYARIEQGENGRWLLKKAEDPAKDQSYVLYSLTQEELEHTRFPLGGYSKPTIRAIAEQQGFLNAHKHDSQDICFVPDGDYASFIRGKTGKAYKPGNFIMEDGTVVGRHRGIIHYTVGQRKGLGIAWKTPLYVLRKDITKNEIVLSENAALFTEHLTARDFNWIAFAEPPELISCTAKTRYQAKEIPCTVSADKQGLVEIRFAQPVRAVTPGQAVVLYDGETVLGGGTIVK